MFRKIRVNLLFSYLLVLALILGIFAIAVRTFIASSLIQQLTEKLIALGQTAAEEAQYNKDFKYVNIEIDRKFPNQDILTNNQALQWFDIQGDLVSQQGEITLNLPFSRDETVQFQKGNTHIESVTLPIIGSKDKKLVGYIRASQSLDEIDKVLNQLDLGLCGGIFVALLLSGLGGVCLTRQAMQPIEDSFQRLQQFTADASHELRSPLMAIKSNAAVAIKYPDGMRSSDAEKFKIIVDASNQMAHLVEDLLFLARNNKIPCTSLVTIDLVLILNNLIQLYKPIAETKEIYLKSDFSQNQNIYILGDSAQIARLFRNLIDNALQYTPSGGVIIIKTYRINSQIYIKVQDTGLGIAPENLEIVFERFWRAEKSRSYHHGGSGLGLAIAQTIAQNHNGLITVTSQLEVGSCFTVCLPVLQSE
ncbi:two-component sensor histidine kinase [Calothrix sp. HK-06]|nr:two-component sensor histidine kinase [Calothrix sp. HK-06]